MTLPELCKTTAFQKKYLLPDTHAMNRRLVCPEYSKSAQEVKSYPLIGHIFALCWYFDGAGALYSTLLPSPEPFCCKFSIGNGQKTQLHTHDYVELAYVVQGNFQQKILGKDIIFQQGDLCLVDKNCIHQDYLYNQNCIVLFFGLSNALFSEIMDKNVATEKIINFLQTSLMQQKNLRQYLYFKPNTPDINTKMEELFFQLVTELSANDAGTPFICKGLMIRIFRLLSAEYEFSLSRDLRHAMNWVVFEEIADYIRQNLTAISIRDLAGTFHFQEDYFNRLIKSKTGMTYSRYVQNLRLEKARQLLLSTHMHIDEIAAAIGYQNKGYFYKLFQNKFSMTPLQMRKKNG